MVDALKLAPTNRGFLNMSDAILAALEFKFAAGQLTASERTVTSRKFW